MKARVQKMSDELKETVILYCVDAEKSEKIRRALSTYNVKLITADVSDSGQKLGTLFGLPGFSREDAEPVPEAEHEALFFGGFNRNRLDLMLGRIRAAGATVSYKAIMTVTNQNYPVSVLMTHLDREHATFSKLDQLNSLSRQLLRYNPKLLPEQARNEATEALARARAILSRPRGIPPEAVEMTIAALQRAIAAAMAGLSAARNAAANAPAPAEQKEEQTEE